ncbi:MAG: helix-turn-helix domain-containing protein [Spirochaetes bacterium]|jgi:DNA-binding transcriptional ArsR family regulator|nr:helix-turn-helix domain-containing protein [Spirochaetota bacterium]
MSDFHLAVAPAEPTVRFDVAPIYNALTSLCLLSQDVGHVSDWVDTTRAKLGREGAEQAGRACEATIYVADSQAQSLPAFLEELSERDPDELRKVFAAHLLRKARAFVSDGQPFPTPDEVLGDKSIFLGVVERIVASHGDQFDADEAGREWERTEDMGAYRDEMVDSIRELWTEYLLPEWNHVTRLAGESVEAFRTLDLSGRSAVEKIKVAVQRDALPEKWLTLIAGAREVVFIPSPHIGPYLLMPAFTEERIYIAGRARIPEGARVQSAELDRSELLVRLEALSDDVRLRILATAAEEGFVTTQVVIDSLGLSQSSASRHLSQLTATGLLSVDTGHRSKRYNLNSRRVNETCDMLKSFLKGRNA